ncbi:hypothetical protein [Klebsiella variicola]|uniref:hypothetical protein n=1 Tax=Klebsiella variicola TaxID=244366 RepID=UPI003B9E1A0E
MSEPSPIRCDLEVAERDVAQLLGDAWDLYLSLPVEHPNERSEFCQAIHACQSIVLSRPAVRALKALREPGEINDQTENTATSS